MDTSMICTGSKQQVKVLSVGEIFAKAKTETFVIPLFQRRYVWGDQQFGNFMVSLEKMMANPKRSHRFNRILLSAQGGECIVLDGQQRLTTFNIFLSCIRDVFCKDAKLVDTINGLLFGSVCPACEEVEFKDGMRLNSALVPSYLDRLPFYKCIIPGGMAGTRNPLEPETSSQMYKCKMFFLRVLSNKYGNNGKNGHKLLGTVLKQFNVLYFGIQETDLWTVYERMDYRTTSFSGMGNDSPGISLTETDMVRNFILCKVLSEKDQISLYESLWIPLERKFKNVSQTMDEMFWAYIEFKTKTQAEQGLKLVSISNKYKLFEKLKPVIEGFTRAQPNNGKAAMKRFLKEITSFTSKWYA